MRNIVFRIFGFGKSDEGFVWLFVGLGNPGEEYKVHRHNAGFMCVDRIAQEYGFSPYRSKFQGMFAEGNIAGHKVGLLKPQTFMNKSGQSVHLAAKFYKIDPDRIYVFHDELDLDFKKIRIKKGGGLAGHNGLKSIKAHLGTEGFRRVRLGIGHPREKARVHSYVLSNFSKEEKKKLDDLFDGVAVNCPLLFNEEEELFMTRVSLSSSS